MDENKEIELKSQILLLEKELELLKRELIQKDEIINQLNSSVSFLRVNLNEDKYKAIIESQAEGIGFVNQDEIFEFANSAADKIFETSQGQLLGKSLLDFLTPTSQEEVKFQTSKRQVGKINEYDLEIITYKGNKKYIHVTASPKVCESGNYAGAYGVFRDITDRKKINEALKKSEEQFSMLFDNNVNAILWANSKGYIQKFNYAAQLLFGYNEDEFLGMHQTKLHPKDDLDFVKNRFSESLIIGKSLEEYRIITKKNEIKYVVINATTIIVENETIQQGIFVDISDLKEAERKIIEQNNRLNELNVAKDKFFSILAHDLKNPFNVIFGYTEMLLNNYTRYDDSHRIKLISSIQRTSKNTYKLLENLLTWSYSQSGKIKVNLEKVNISEYVKEIVSEMKVIAYGKAVNLTFDSGVDSVVEYDLFMLGTILRNLITNAIKYTLNGGEIKVSSREIESSIEIVISDTGVGMSEKTLNSLFSLEKTISRPGTSGEQGTGFGLKLCKEFVENHSGKIRFESVEGKGTHVRFTIPKNAKIIV